MNNKKIFSKAWQGIEFKSFANLSKHDIADSSFYDNFYEQLFAKYSCYDELEKEWLDKKSEVVDFLDGLAAPNSRLLSIGCGLGFIEARLWHRRSKNLEIHVQDFAEKALKWVSEVIPSNNVHGRDWSCATHFDVIFLGAIDYALDDTSFVALLKEMKLRLKDNGQIVIVSASFFNNASFRNIIYSSFKDAVKYLLDCLGLFDRGQFWGWLRSRDDYRRVLSQAGFDSINDGFIETTLQKTYYIKAV
jgi:ubiquinone/menaquinone biosynthesis C-methylase UbiE